MLTRIVLPSAQPMYAAASRWRHEAVIEDRSLFDGRPIDGVKVAQELKTYFVENLDEGSGTFISKLKSQLKHVSDDAVQCAAELLYIHCLIASTKAITSRTKLGLVNGVIDFRGTGTSRVPETLAEVMRAGVATPGQAYNSYRWKMFAYLINVFGEIKKLPKNDRRKALSSLSDFQASISRVDDQSVWSQRFALEHLLFPDETPAVLAREDRAKIKHALGNEDQSFLDTIAGLPPNLEYGGAECVNLYRTPYRETWDGWSDTVVTYGGWGSVIATHIDLDERERNYKIERVPALLDALRCATDGEDLLPALTRALRNFNVVDFRVTDDFLRWAASDPVAASTALRELQREPGPASIDRFLAAVPLEALPGAGTRLSVASTLLMSLSPEQFPPWRRDAVDATRRLAGGYPPQESATAGETYLLFLERLDVILKIVNADSNRALLRDRLDAQGLAWTIVSHKGTVPGLDEATSNAFHAWRDGKSPAGPVADLPRAEPDAPLGPAPDTATPTSMEDLAASLHMEEGNTEWLEETLALLEQRRQIILQGPPGTGKTFIGRAIAEFLAGTKNVEIVQFHPGTSYEDFIQGLRPLPDQPSAFGVVDGPLLRLAKRAQSEPDGRFVLLIDEINRGNVPAVFGELYYLLEYRDRPVTLMYGGKQELPPNLFIIGTMNTADRSITALDSALRRRFYARDLRPSEEPLHGIFRTYLRSVDPSLLWLSDLLDRANEVVNDADQAVGPSHFMGSEVSETWARRAWQNSVMPTLREVFYSQPDRVADLQFDVLRAAVAGPAVDAAD